MPSAELLWLPSDQRGRASQMYAFMVGMAAKYGFSPDYPSLHRWSITRRDQFWKEMFDFVGIQSTKPATAVGTGSGMLGTKCFPGLEFNFVAHLLRFNDDRIAIEAEDELGRTRSITYRE